MTKGDERHEDTVRLLRYEPLVDETQRRALTIAADLLWDDLLDCVESD